MSFYLSADESVEEGVKRVVTEQIGKAIEEVDDEEIDCHETVHQVRKRCKKIRGAIRLVRPVFDGYSDENAFFRDAAKELSYVRDAEAIVETFDELVGKFGHQIDEDAIDSLRGTITDRRKKIAEDEVGIDRQLGEFREAMCQARERVPNWKLSAKGFDAIEPGLLKTYGRGRNAMAAACKDPTVENFHEWRKRTKYHWYHCRLLQRTWKPMMKKICSEVKDLADSLGDDHDLAVFRQMLLDSPDDFGSEQDIQLFLGLLDRYSAERRTKAKTLGARFFAEKPKQLGRRFGTYWDAWQDEKHTDSSKLNRKPAVVTA